MSKFWSALLSCEREMETLSSSSSSPHHTSYTHSADVSASDSSRYFSGRHFTSGQELLLFDDTLKPPLPDPSEVELMKERFAKLLLGEDMSGSGKGACTALAVSNAITNLSATVFGELWRLEPLAAPKMAMWVREMEWLLCITDSIVEFSPSRQDFPGGGTFEVMVARPRSDLYMNLPALKKLDAMLVGMLDGFRGTEFCYVDRGVLVGDSEDEFPSPSTIGRPSLRQEEKWWLPCPRLPVNGLSEDGRKRLQQCRDCASQILKAAMAINSGVLAEMEVPDAYFDALPKSGKSCLGEMIYRYITADRFSPECLLDCLDVSSEHQALEIANRVEAAVHVWKLKDCKRYPLHLKPKKSSWGGRVMGFVGDAVRSHFLAQRAEGLLQSLRLRYTGLPQTDLDMTKIQYNKDVGQAILESYSRVLESLAFNIMARIDDLIYVDDATKKCAAAEAGSLFNRGLGGLPAQKMISPGLFSIENTPYGSPFTTPSYYSPTRVTGSPGRAQPSPSKGGHQDLHDWKSGKSGKGVVADTEKAWSYAGTLSARKDGDVRERD